MAKANKKVVVTKAYLDLIRRKADLLDEMFDWDSVNVSANTFKAHAKIEKDANKLGVHDFDEVPYIEPEPALKRRAKR